MADSHDTAPMSIRAYARRRGVSAPAVLNAIAAGRLRASIVQTDQGQKIGDPDLADREWAENTDHTKQPAYVKAREAERVANGGAGVVSEPPTPSKDPTFLEAAAAEKVWKAKIAELDFKEKSGALVDAVALEARLVETFTRCRTKLLGLPSKLASARPNLTRDDLIAADRIVREALEELGTTDTPATSPAEGVA